LYSWSRSLGGEFLGMYAYYLASPLSWIVLLFPENMITDAIWLMLVLKTGICGLTMAVFLDRVYPTKTLNTILFSTLYAFCAYNLAYMSNIMWIDGVMFLPLLILGLERLLAERKFKLYTLSLTCIILANYCIGFMICIFVVLYIINYHIIHGKNTVSGKSTNRYYYLGSFIRVGVYSIISVAMSAVIILPAYYSLQFGKADYGNTYYSEFEIQNFTDLFSKLFFGHFDTISPDGSPFVYCGMLTLLTLPLFFLSKQISVREKLGSTFLLMILIVSMVIPELDILWHGGQTPNWMNFRYSFIFSFVLIVLAYRGFASIRQINLKCLSVISGILIACAVFISWLDYGERYGYVQTFNLEYNRFILSTNLFIVIVLSVILWRYKTSLGGLDNHEADDASVLKRGPVIGLAACVLLEAYIAGVLQNTTLAMDVGYASRNSYVDFINTTQPAVDYIYQNDDGFYRMEKTFFRMGNDNMALDIRGISGFTSTLNSNTLDLLKRLGYSSSSYISWYYGGNPVNDSLIGIKYIISDSKGIEKQQLSNFYNLIYEDEANDRYVFKNPYALSIAFAVSEDITEIGEAFYNTPFDMLNAVYSMADGYGTNMFHALDVLASDVIREEHAHSECENQEHDHDETSKCREHYIRSYICQGIDEPVYLYLPVYSRNDLHIFLNGKAVELTVPLDCSAGILSLGKFESGTKYEIVMCSGNPALLTDGRNILYALDMSALRRITDTIQKNQLAIESAPSEVQIRGNITSTEEKPILFTTIPYDKNWQVYVDGEIVQNILTLDSLLAVELPPGDHEIVFQYKSAELIAGSVVSFAGLAVFGCIVFWESRKKRLFKD